MKKAFSQPKASAAASLEPMAATSFVSRLKSGLTRENLQGLASIPNLVRGLLLLFAATLPLYYDLAVPEVSGDVRWFATLVFAGACTLLLLVDKVWHAESGPLTCKMPLQLWIALGLAIWAAISLIDALNWMRGIILLKALYSQILLLIVVYAVATPRFIRALLWAMVLPLVFTSFLGIVQFHGWNGMAFENALQSHWEYRWFLPILHYGLDPLGDFITGLVSNGQRNYGGFIDFITNYFMQSAVPGSTFANKNLAGSWTAMMLPILLYLLLTSRHWGSKFVASTLLALGTLFLIETRARASWLAFFAATLTFVALVLIVPAWRKAVLRHLDWRHAIWLLLPLVILFRHGADISPVKGAYAIDRSLTAQVTALAGSTWDEVGGRLAYNLNSLVITKDYWFNGVGLGGFYVIYPPYSHAVVPTPPNSYSVMARPQRTHTDLMQAFDEMGVPGGLLYAGFFITAIALAFRLAGPRAGAVGGKMVATGCVAGITVLAIFLEYKDMLAIPTPWNYVFYGVMSLIALGLFALFVRDAKAVQAEQTEADELQLMGFMAGISILGISLNALMDFPMQLPTAPAAAVLMMGAILYAAHHSGTMQSVGPDVTRILRKATAPTLPAGAKRAVYAVLTVLVGYAFWWGVNDAIQFRRANVLLKQGMVLVYSGINDDHTLQYLAQAYTVYPLDPRVHEYIGVVFANYNGQMPITLEDRLNRMEWVLKGDPWGANHLINALGLYYQLADKKQKAGETAEANRLLARAEVLYNHLQQAADFSEMSWAAGGVLRMMQGKPEEASALFRRALAINPGYEPARNGLMMAQTALGVSPVVVSGATVNSNVVPLR